MLLVKLGAVLIYLLSIFVGRNNFALVNVCLFVCFFVNLKQARIIWEHRISIEKMIPSGWPVGKSFS